jgi:hypothetical protein
VISAVCFFMIPPFHVGRGFVWYLWEDIYVMAALALLGLVAFMLMIRRRRSGRRASVLGMSSVPLSHESAGA